MPQSLKKEIICIAPDFLGEFECIGSKCLHTCCSSAWKISIDKRTYQKYLRAPVCEDTRRLLGRYIRKNNSKNVADPINEYAGIVFEEGDAFCPFLDGERLCRLQKELGAEALGSVCRTFPRIKYMINGVYYRGLSLACEAAAAQTLSKKEGICFVRVPFENDTYHAPASIIDKRNEQIVDTPLFYFEDIRFFILSLLQNRDYRVWERVVILGMFMKALDDCGKEGALALVGKYGAMADEGFFREELKKLPRRFDIQLQMSSIISSVQIVSEEEKEQPSMEFLEFIDRVSKGLMISDELSPAEEIQNYQKIFEQYYEPYMEENEYIMENFLVATVFNAAFPISMKKDKAFEEFGRLAMFFALGRFFLVAMAGAHKGLDEKLVIDTLTTTARHYDIRHTTSINGSGKILKKLSADSLAWYAGLLRE